MNRYMLALVALAALVPFMLPDRDQRTAVAVDRVELTATSAYSDHLSMPWSKARPATTANIKEAVSFVSDNWVDRTKLDQEMSCLARAIYFEARSEPVEGQLAVAQVILNRVRQPNFPGTICGVVYEDGAGGKRHCQFSFACDGLPDTPADSRAWRTAQSVGIVAKEGIIRDITWNATYYHTTQVTPGWGMPIAMTRRLGDHVFYKLARN